MTGIQIRLYQKEDRQAIRDICFETAHLWQSLIQTMDKELFLDFITSYYTDYDSRAVWVAVYNGNIVGYLTGCLDEGHYQKMVMFKIFPKLTFKCLFNIGFWKTLNIQNIHAFLKTVWWGGFRRQIPVKEFSAHLHINLRGNHTGQKIGALLMAQFIEQARENRSTGIYLNTRSDNPAACRFFERSGFTELQKHAVAIPEDHTLKKVFVVTYVRKL